MLHSFLEMVNRQEALARTRVVTLLVLLFLLEVLEVTVEAAVLVLPVDLALLAWGLLQHL